MWYPERWVNAHEIGKDKLFWRYFRCIQLVPTLIWSLVNMHKYQYERLTVDWCRTNTMMTLCGQVKFFQGIPYYIRYYYYRARFYGYSLQLQIFDFLVFRNLGQVAFYKQKTNYYKENYVRFRYIQIQISRLIWIGLSVYNREGSVTTADV